MALSHFSEWVTWVTKTTQVYWTYIHALSLQKWRYTNSYLFLLPMTPGIRSYVAGTAGRARIWFLCLSLLAFMTIPTFNCFQRHCNIWKYLKGGFRHQLVSLGFNWLTTGGAQSMFRASRYRPARSSWGQGSRSWQVDTDLHVHPGVRGHAQYK